VYDVLRALTDAGLLRRVELPGSPSARYELWRHDNHHHLVCRSCGDVVDVPCATGDAPCLVPARTAGFAIDEAEVVYRGLCPTCQHVPDERN
jgi:Fur family transcriptional regulator, stress-responsive regulator